MLGANRLQSLSQLPAPVLTVYLHASPARAHQHGILPSSLAWLSSQGQSLARSLPPTWRELFGKQFTRTVEFLRNRTPHERSLVIFAGSTAWETVSLQVEVDNELHWGMPALSQLLRLISEHKAYCIVAVDRAGACFFRYSLGEMTELNEKKFAIDISQWKKKELGHVTGQGVRKTRGSQRDTFEHRMDAQYSRLCRETAQQTMTLCEKDGLAAVFLVGSGHFIKPLQAEFPSESGRPVVPIQEDLARISRVKLLQHMKPRIAEWERAREVEMVSAILDADRGAVLGIDETLAQLQKRKTRAVVVAQDLDAPLRQCISCSWADRSSDPVCPSCGSARVKAGLRQLLPELAHRYGTDIRYVSGEAAEKLKEAGGMGAWLCQPRHAEFSRAAM
jgi:release factor family 10